MKLSAETQRKVVMDALLRADGDRQKAAEDIGVSFRSINRYIKDLDLYPFIDKMGWNKHKGPPRTGAGTPVIRMRILAHIRKHAGSINYGELTMEIYGADGRPERQRIYSALTQMQENGQIRIEGDRWVTTDNIRQIA